MLSDVAALVEDYPRYTTKDGMKQLTEEERNKLGEKLAFRGITTGNAEKRRLENSNSCLVLVAYTADDLPVGYSDSAYDGSNTLEAGMLVRDGYEGRGVGLRLMRQHIIEAKKMGTKKIKAVVLRKNKLMNQKLEQDWRESLKDLCTTTLEGIGAVAAAQGEAEWAARLWGAAQALRVALGMPLPSVYRPDYERALATARSHLGEEAFATALAEGRTMTLEQTLEALPRVFSRLDDLALLRQQQAMQPGQPFSIEIDEERLAQEVAEITESDFFQRLLQQAQCLRSD